ncbi:MAG: GT-D fold domain-containing glycosyltransferase [Candidatus Dependentiae bacterium]
MKGLKTIIFLNIIFLSNTTYGLIFHGTQETLQEIKNIIENKQSGCYLRFGDGDLNLAYGMNELCQLQNAHLQHEMQEAFSLNHKTIIKTLPLHCKEFGGLEKHMFPGNHEVGYEQACQFVARAQPLWGQEITDIYSPVALAYTATYNVDICLDFLKFLKSQNCLLLIGNECIPNTIIKLLFGNQTIFIPTPAVNAYSSINEIEEQAQKILREQDDTYKIVVLSMGCSGRILTKRLWKSRKNIFIFDFGSLMDALCGWNTRAWIELTQFDKNQILIPLNNHH